MNTRIRLVVVGSALLGTVVVAAQQIWQRRPSLVHEHVWAGMSGNGVANAVEGGDGIAIETWLAAADPVATGPSELTPRSD